MLPVPVLEIGGTHVTAALVDPASGSVTHLSRAHVAADGDADAVLGTFADAAATLPAARGGHWGVAIPDPFDYATGVAWFAGVGKFEALYGVDVGARLAAAIVPPPQAVDFVNDADAFLLGEWAHGAARRAPRCAAITLGTGVGSAFLVDGVPLDRGEGVPPGGRAHRVVLDGRPLEDLVSRRAIREAYRAATGDAAADVRDIAERMRAGEAAATDTLRRAFTALGRALGPLLVRFAADVVVIGGSMAGSWDLFEPVFRAAAGPVPPTELAAHPEASPLVGAAWHAERISRRR